MFEGLKVYLWFDKEKIRYKTHIYDHYPSLQLCLNQKND